MKNILVAIVTCLFLFGASAATSFYLNQPLEIEENSEGEGDSEGAMDPEAETEPEGVPKVNELANQMPVAARPDQALTIEAVRQMTEAAEKRQMQLDELQNQLRAEEDRVKILFEDLRREESELTAFSESIDAKIQTMDSMTIQLNDLIRKLDKRKMDLEKLKQETGVDSPEEDLMDEKINLTKGWFEGLEAVQAAEYLKTIANSGELKYAAGLLHSLQDRQKSKILAAIGDGRLVQQLIDNLEIKRKEN